MPLLQTVTSLLSTSLSQDAPLASLMKIHRVIAGHRYHENNIIEGCTKGKQEDITALAVPTGKGCRHKT